MSSRLFESCKCFLCFGKRPARPESPYEMGVMSTPVTDDPSSDTLVRINEFRFTRIPSFETKRMTSLESNTSYPTDSQDMETEHDTLESNTVRKQSFESVISQEASSSTDSQIEADFEVQPKADQELETKMYVIEHIPGDTQSGESSDIIMVVPMTKRRRASVPMFQPHQVYH
ncbi:unnamed protein product [Orchesella dallaii]|uniref:Uncharacterized protein n=1 Tax=Orchesella dallaii TaxID=48710 RepID=A0ABP1QH45_9HEXA